MGLLTLRALKHVPFGWNQPNGMCPVKQHRPRAHFRAEGTARGSLRSEISSLLFVVTALVFLLVAIAMIAAVGGRRAIAGGLFGLSFALSVVWLVLHMTGPLNLSF